MKILTVNRNYFITGGPEKYMFSLMENMPEHTFIPFCLDFSQNYKSSYSKYFIKPPGGADNIYFKHFNMSPFQKARYGINMIYSSDAKKKIGELIDREQPDAALFLNAVYFTDSIIDACRNRRIPILWRLSDFNKICTNYLLYRDGQVCEDCLEKGLWSIIQNKCGGYQRSLGAAAIKAMSMYLSRIRKSNDYVSYFITPSQFTRKKMIKGGFNPEKIVHIPTFINAMPHDSEDMLETNHLFYVGRISPEKGVDLLIKAFTRIKNTDAVLSIAGDTQNEYAKQLMDTLPDSHKNRIKFMGFKTQNEIKQLFCRSLYFIVPSVCYENQPNVVLEGMACSRAALVSDSGSLSEMVTDGKNGYCFKSGNIEDLAEKMDWLLDNPMETIEMGKAAKSHISEQHSPKKHLDALNHLFKSVVYEKPLSRVSL